MRKQSTPSTSEPSTTEILQAYELLKRQDEQDDALLEPLYRWAHRKKAESGARALRKGEKTEVTR